MFLCVSKYPPDAIFLPSSVITKCAVRNGNQLSGNQLSGNQLSGNQLSEATLAQWPLHVGQYHVSPPNAVSFTRNIS